MCANSAGRRPAYIVRRVGLVVATLILTGSALGQGHEITLALAETILDVDRPRIAYGPDGSVAIALEILSQGQFESSPRRKIAVQRYSPAGAPIGPTHVFRGESCSGLDMWTSDYMEHAEIAFRPDGILIVLMQHSGRFHIGSDDVGSAEATIGAINTTGQIIDLNESSQCVQHKLVFPGAGRQDRPRFALAPNGALAITADGFFGGSNARSVGIRILDTNLDRLFDEGVPHSDVNSSQSFHMYPDIATNGSLLFSVWQRCPMIDAQGNPGECDIEGQFVSVTANGELALMGENLAVTSGDPPGTFSIWPSAAMSGSGESVVVWADTRLGWDGEVFGQRFDASGNPVGVNFQVSIGEGEVYFRPEVALLDDGRFMIAWTDSSSAGFRARARKYASNGEPLGPPFALGESVGLQSGLPAVAAGNHDFEYVWLAASGGAVPAVFTNNLGMVVPVEHGESPHAFTLDQNFPNPFAHVTRITYSLSEPGHVFLCVYDILGRPVAELVNGKQPSGAHSAVFDASSLSPGLYLFHLESGGFGATRSMSVLR